MAEPEPTLPNATAHQDGEGPARTQAGGTLDWLDRLVVLQEQQWQAGERILVETFFTQEPLLRLDHSAQLHLIANERVFRAQRGESPTFEEYLARFPKLERELKELFHQSFTSPTMTFGAPRPENTYAKIEDTRPDSKFRTGVPGKRSGTSISLHFLQAAEAAGYEIIEELGRGGMGIVYKARHKSLKRYVAIKTLSNRMQVDEEQLARFRKEAMAIAKLQHPNIVAVYDVGEFEENPYLALEFVDGGSLADLLMKARQSPLQAAMLVEPLARAAHLAHTHGIIHRDLKPANILLAKDGTPKISDFGLAKQMDESTGWTRTGDIMGTPCYMAPEQAEGRIKALGPCTDVYALGAILYEVVTGHPPFRGVTSLETLEQVRTKEPLPLRKWLPSVPRDLETIVLKCLEKDPLQRYPSATALADDLQRFIQDEPILAKRGNVLTRLGRWWKKNQVVAALFLMIAVLVVILGQQLIRMALRGGNPPETAQASQSQPSSPLPLPTTSLAADLPRPIPTPEPMQPVGSVAAVPTPPAMATRPVPPTKPEATRPATFDQFVASAQAAKTPAEALEHYESAWNLARNSRPREKVQRYRTALVPALALADQLPADAPAADRSRAARLYAEKGRLLRDHPYEDWGFSESVHRVAGEAFSQAIRLHPAGAKPDRAAAEYHTGRGLALCRLGGTVDGAAEKQLLADADAAIAAAPDYAGGWNLKGYVLYHQAFAEYRLGLLEAHLLKAGAAKLPMETIQAAIGAYDQAVRLAQDASPPDDNAPTYLVNRSAAQLLKGYLESEVSARKAAWKLAAADAEAALKLWPDNELAWQALGLAQESLARKSLRVAEADAYPKARAAYEEQLKIRAASAVANFNLGRCLAEWGLESDGGPEVLAASKAALQDALRYDSSLGEANYWLGRLLWQAGDKPAAMAAWRAAMHGSTAPGILQQLEATLAGDAPQFRDLLDAAVQAASDAAKDRPTPELFPLLLLRASWLAEKESADLEKEKPQALTDAQAAMKVASGPMQEALAHLAATVILDRILKSTKVPVEARLPRLVEFCRDLEAYLKLRPDSPFALPLLRQLSNSLEALGKDSRRSKEERLDFLRRALGHAERAAELSTGPERSTWQRRREDLQRDVLRVEAEDR